MTVELKEGTLLMTPDGTLVLLVLLMNEWPARTWRVMEYRQDRSVVDARVHATTAWLRGCKVVTESFNGEEK